MRPVNNITSVSSLCLLFLLLLLPAVAMALPECDDIFKKRPKTHVKPPLSKPDNIGPFLGDVSCEGKRICSFPSAFDNTDYDFGTGYFRNVSAAKVNKITTRLYFKKLDLEETTFNKNGNAENLIIYVSGNLYMRDSHINGIVYVVGNAEIENSTIDGGLASSNGLRDRYFDYKFDDDYIENANFGGMCKNDDDDKEPSETKLIFNYGQAKSVFTHGDWTKTQQVTFDKPFPQGEKPLVFLMPTINVQTKNTASTVVLTEVTNNGFKWKQIFQPYKRRASADNVMKTIDWIAVNSGVHYFEQMGSDNAVIRLKMRAGEVGLDEALWLNETDEFEDTKLDSNLSVVLSQIQPSDTTKPNNCWLTSLAMFDDKEADELLVGIDASQVYSTHKSRRGDISAWCKPGNQNLEDLKNKEKVAYFAVTPGFGTLKLNNQLIKFEFSHNNKTAVNNAEINMLEQCQIKTQFTVGLFNKSPILVAGKNSRNGLDGGWLRQCSITKENVGMVVDEDNYTDSERNHQNEFYSFVALAPYGVIAPSIHHFEFDYTGFPLACAPQHITLKACKNADCSELITEQVTATLSPANGGSVTWLDSNKNTLANNTITFSGGSVVLYLRQYSHVDTVTLDVPSATPSQAKTTVCKQNGLIASCDLNFAQAGFIIDNIDKYANKPADIKIKAVRQSTGSLECQPTFGNQTKNLEIKVNYLNPVTPFIDSKHNQPFTLSQHNQTTRFNKGDSSFKSVPIVFDENGIASLSVNYADAGFLNLNAQYMGTDQEDNGLVMQSTGGEIKSIPYGFCVETEDASQCHKVDKSTCKVYKKAGESFPLTISAKAWHLARGNQNYCNNLTTPSFEMDNVSLDHQLLAPNNIGTQKGSLGINHQSMKRGLQTKFDQSISEVGVFQFSGSNPKNQNYLDSSLKINTGWSQHTGRFVPAWFDVIGYITPACDSGNFSYMSQPFSLRSTITALNTNGLQTYNYMGTFAKGDAYLSAESLNNQNLSHRFINTLDASNIIDLPWKNGIATIHNKVSFMRDVKPVVDGPFDLSSYGINVIDNETPQIAQVKTPNLNTISSCTGDACHAKKLGTQNIRFGRITMDNVYGSETETLYMPGYVQYWAGEPQKWQINTLDNCTSFGESANQINPALMTQIDKSIEGYRFDPAIDPSLNQKITRQGNKAFANGQFQLLWQSLGAPKYRGKVTAPLSVPEWLKYYWNWNDKNHANEDPRSSAYFGRYRGHDKIIYWHEVH